MNEPQDLTPPSIIFEDEHIFIINKPSLIHSVAISSSEAPSIASSLLVLRPELASVGDKAGDAGLANRLDFETSGILLGAKSRESWKRLREILQSGSIEKSYLALIEGLVSNKEEISSFIGNPNRGASKVRVYFDTPRKKDRALPAHTVIEPIFADQQRDASLVRVLAHTARRHQIRAHAASIKHPLVGDTTYGSTRSLGEIFQSSENAPTFLLHAHTISFMHPILNHSVRIEAPEPEILNEWRGRGMQKQKNPEQ